MTGASSGVFGASSGVLVTPNQETLHFVRVCVLIFYVLFLREPQLLDASSDRGDSGGAGKLSKIPVLSNTNNTVPIVDLT